MITTIVNDSIGARFHAGILRAAREYEEKQAAWRESLRAAGVAATHPDDGWVNREKNTLHLCYPHIMGELKIGSLVALGDHEKYRIVRLASFRRWLTGIRPNDGEWSFANAPALGRTRSGRTQEPVVRRSL